MEIKNTAQFDALMKKQIKKMMSVAATKVEADMFEETGDYYSGGNPVMYERTGALGDSPKVTALTEAGDQFSFEAYLDQNHQYSTGSEPTMLQVLFLANNGIPFTTRGGVDAHHTIGKKGFWERAEKKMEKTFKKTAKSFFR